MVSRLKRDPGRKTSRGSIKGVLFSSWLCEIRDEERVSESHRQRIALDNVGENGSAGVDAKAVVKTAKPHEGEKW